MTDLNLAFSDSLFDQLARLDDLFETAGRRSSSSLQPILAHLRQTVHGLAGELLQQSDDPARLTRLAAAVADCQQQLDLVPGMTMPIECDYLLTDLLGVAGQQTAPPPVVLAAQPQVGARAFGPELMCLQLPLVYRESPLSWTLIAGELGCWLANRERLTARLLEGRDLTPAAAGWLARLTADLIALRLTGPAYLAAMTARQPQTWLNETSLSQRLALLFDALEARGFDLTWRAHLAAGDAELPAGVRDLLGQAVTLVDDIPDLPAFEPGDMAKAMALVADLKDGLPISAAPRPTKAEQEACLARFKGQGDRFAAGSASDLLTLFTDQPNPAAVILNAGWRYRWEIGTDWLQEVRHLAPAEALGRYRAMTRHLDQLLEKSIETAALHRLLQEAL